MARRPRIQFPGSIHHVTVRGDRQEPIYRDDVDRHRHLDVFGLAAARYGARALAWCQMGNHCHWVIRTDTGRLDRLMRQVNGIYTQAFNRRHGLTGHVFQGRYHATLVDREAYLVTVCRYVERNPVAAGLVARAQDWRWSSCRAHLGLARADDWLDVEGVRALLLGRPPAGAADKARAIAMYADGLVDPDDTVRAFEVLSPRRKGLPQERPARDRAIVQSVLGGRSPREVAAAVGLSAAQVVRIVRTSMARDPGGVGDGEGAARSTALRGIDLPQRPDLTPALRPDPSAAT